MDATTTQSQQQPLAPAEEASTKGIGGEQDLAALNLYLSASCGTLLDLNRDKFHRALHEPANQDLLAQFAQDKNQRALLVARIDQRGRAFHDDEEHKDEGQKDEAAGGGSTGKDPEVEPAEDGRAKASELIELLHGDEIKFSLKVQYHGAAAHTLAFLKRESYTVLDLRGDEAGEHVSKQLQLLNLGYIGEDFSIFELAATYVEYSLLPLFNSYKTSKATLSDKGGPAAAGFESIQKNLAQLKVHLVQCQQNIIVPEIELIHDAEIKAKNEECKALGRELTTEDFEGRLQDPNFVKRLEKTVTQWIKDIRRITQLNHDPQQGSALQEINFWLSIERSLAHIEEQLKNNMLDVTLRLLQQAQKIQLVYHF
jgi:hypothetical protein